MDDAVFSPHDGSGAERDILEGILAASTDACWCMEFTEPVDLTAPDGEVIRQVFENGPYWRFCNAAMAQLYLLPADQDLNTRPVSEIFPRNVQNEAFIHDLLSNGFEVDAAPALDMRYDGVEIHVENDVRAHIQGGRLLRMFGIVRDVGKHYRREARLQARLDDACQLIEMLPDAVFGIGPDGRIRLASDSGCDLLQVSRDGLLGQPISDAVVAAGGVGADGLAEELRNGAMAASGTIEIAGRTLGWTLSRPGEGRSDGLAALLVLRNRAQA